MIDKEIIKPVHPGEFLLEDFMKPLGLKAYRVAKDIGVPTTRIDDILAGRRAITVNTAIRLGAYFGTSAEVWLGIQNQYDLDRAKDAGVPDVKPCTAKRVEPVTA